MVFFGIAQYSGVLKGLRYQDREGRVGGRGGRGRDGGKKKIGGKMKEQRESNKGKVKAFRREEGR